MLKLGDREPLQKDMDRDSPKRRRIDKILVQQKSGGNYRENLSTDSSDAEFFEEEKEARFHQKNRMKQLPPLSSCLTNNRRGFRSLRSSPVLRTAGDEVLGVPIPRRARSASAKKLNEHPNSGDGGFGEDLRYREFSLSPATKHVESGTRILSSALNSKPSLMIQDDIEMEVAEALFDLMKQSHAQSHTKIDRVSTTTDDLKSLKPEREKDENNAFKFQTEQSIEGKAETIFADSTKELNQGGRIEKEDFPDDPARELVTGDWFVDNRKVGSLRESESQPCVNACDIQDPTATNADGAARGVVEAKEFRIDINLMLQSLPSLERDAVLDVDSKFRTPDVQNKSETSPTDGTEEIIGVISDNQLLSLNLERHSHDILSVGQSTSQQPSGRKEPKSQPSLLSFPIAMGSWAGVLPNPICTQSHSEVLSTYGCARSSIMQSPQFKFSQSRRKRCATHRYIADNIQNHQQLLEKSLSSVTTGAAILDGTKTPSFKSMLPTQRFSTVNQSLRDIEGGRSSTFSSSRKDKSSHFAADFSATISKSALEQASNRTPAINFLHHPGSTFPLSPHHRTQTMTPSNSSGPPPHQSASPINNAALPSNNNSSRKLSSTEIFNHSIFPSNEAAAASYMAILQNSGYPFPIPTNISLPSSKGGPSYLNSSFYSPPVFDISRNQDSLKYMGFAGNSNNNKHVDIPQPFPMSLGLNSSPHVSSSSMAGQNLSIFRMHSETPRNGNKTTSAGKSMMSCSEFDNKSQSTGFLPSIPNYYHHNKHQTQTHELKSSTVQWNNIPRATTNPEGSNIPQLKNSRVRNRSSPNSSNLKNTSNGRRKASQETDGSSSPACRRTVTPILSTCAGQVSELLKY